MNAAIALLAPCLLCLACQDKPGPPVRLELEVNGNPALATGAISPTLVAFSAAGAVVEVDAGTLEYVVYEGPPARDSVRCRTSVQITAEHFSKQHVEDYAEPQPVLEVLIAPPEGCTPLPDSEQTFGIFTLVLPNGQRVTASKASFVHTAIGGEGEVNFPESYDVIQRARAKRSRVAATRDRVVDKLVATAEARTEQASCPPGTSGTYWRADRRALSELAGQQRMPRDVAFDAINDPDIAALVRHHAAETLERGIDVSAIAKTAPAYVVVVDVASMTLPAIVDPGTADRKGSYRPGAVAGRLTVVDLHSGAAVCAGPFEGEGQGGDFTTKKGQSSATWLIETAFLGTVSTSVHQGATRLAPNLRRPASRPPR